MKKEILVLMLLLMLITGCGRVVQSMLEDTADNCTVLASWMDPHVKKADARKQTRDLDYVSRYLKIEKALSEKNE